MFDREELSIDPTRNRTRISKTTQLYSKKFTRDEWDKLDIPIPELGYSMTLQKLLESKYNIVLEEKIEYRREEKIIKDFLTKSLLEKSIQENKVLVNNGNKLKKKFLLYSKDHIHLEGFINSIDFEKTRIRIPKRNLTPF